MIDIPLTGLIAAAFTPFHRDGRLNVDAIPAMSSYFCDVGISGVFVGGTTGESHSLSLPERIELTQAWCDAAPPPLLVVAHVGSNCQRDAIEMARQADRAGARGISVMAPNFFKPATVEQLLDYCEPVARAAPEVPFYFYHIPQMTGVELSVAEFLGVAVDRIPNLAGVKYTGGDLMDLQACAYTHGRQLDLLFGQDENLLAGLALGLRAAIGSTYNYAPGIYLRVIEAFEAGDLEAARCAQAQSVELVAVLKKFGVVPAGKEIMRMLGQDCGQVRSPLTALSAGQRRRLFEALEPLDVFPHRLSCEAIEA